MRSLSRLAAILAAGVLSCLPLAAQTMVKDSALPAAGTLAGTEGLRAVQGSGCPTSISPCANVRVTPVQLASYMTSTGLFQASDVDLAAIAALSTQGYGRTLLTMPDAPTTRGYLGLAIGSNVEAWSANLDALAATTGTNTIYYRSGANSWAPVTFGPNFSFSAGSLTIPGLPITLSGDASGASTSGSGAMAMTLKTVNSAPGTCGAANAIPQVTVNAKGLTTGCTTSGPLAAVATSGADTDLIGAAWTAYTPSVAAASGTLSSYSSYGRYKRVGKTVFLRITVIIGSSGNGSAAGYLIVGIPFASASIGNANYQQVIACKETNAVGFGCTGNIGDGISTMNVTRSSDGSYPGGNGYTLTLTGEYEAA